MKKKLRKITIPDYLFDKLLDLESEREAIEICISKVKSRWIFKYLLKRMTSNKKDKKVWWEDIMIAGDFPRGQRLEYDTNLKEVREIEKLK